MVHIHGIISLKTAGVAYAVLAAHHAVGHWSVARPDGHIGDRCFLLIGHIDFGYVGRGSRLFNCSIWENLL